MWFVWREAHVHKRTHERTHQPLQFLEGAAAEEEEAVHARVHGGLVQIPACLFSVVCLFVYLFVCVCMR